MVKDFIDAIRGGMFGIMGNRFVNVIVIILTSTQALALALFLILVQPLLKGFWQSTAKHGRSPRIKDSWQIIRGSPYNTSTLTIYATML